MNKSWFYYFICQFYALLIITEKCYGARIAIIKANVLFVSLFTITIAKNQCLAKNEFSLWIHLEMNEDSNWYKRIISEHAQ